MYRQNEEDILGLSLLEYSLSLPTKSSNSFCRSALLARLFFCRSGLYFLKSSSSVGETQYVSAGPPTMIAPPLQRLVSRLAGWLAGCRDTSASSVFLKNKTHPRIIFAHIPQFVGFFDMVGSGGVWHERSNE